MLKYAKKLIYDLVLRYLGGIHDYIIKLTEPVLRIYDGKLLALLDDIDLGELRNALVCDENALQCRMLQLGYLQGVLGVRLDEDIASFTVALPSSSVDWT